MREYTLDELTPRSSFLYHTLNWLKYKKASEIWKKVLMGYEDWKEHVDKADYWVYESGRYGWKVIDENLTHTDKALYFFDALVKNLGGDEWAKFISLFPDEYHDYSDENFKKLIEVKRALSSRQKINVGHRRVDDETATMSALSNGYGDEIGF